MLAIVRALLAVVLVLPLLAAAAPLRVVVDQNYPPFILRNSRGELEGYSIDLWRLWQQKTGMQVELRGVNWLDAQPMLERGEADVVDDIFLTESRASHFDFSRPYATIHTAIYADASIGGIHDLASLKGFEVGVEASDACGERLERAGVTGVRYFPTIPALFAAVANHSVKLICIDDNAAEYQLYRLGLHRQYVRAFEVTRAELRRAVRKGDTATLALVERGMAQITPAEVQALREKWMGRPLQFARYSRRMADVMLALGGLVALLLVWLASVRRAVRMRTVELEREKTLLNTLVESSTDLIWLKDTAGVYQACNAQTAALLGRPHDEIIGKRDVDLFGAALAEGFRYDDEAALQARRPLMVEDRVVVPGLPDTRVFETLKTPIVKPDGTVLGVLGVARDITDRKAHERKIREQERLLKEMSTLAQIGAWELDPANGAFQWTDEVARIYDIPPGQALALAYCLARCEEGDRMRAERALDAATAHGKLFDLELQIVTDAGNRKWIRLICSPVLENERVVTLRGTVQDITHRRNLEESMRMANLIYRTTSEAIVVTDGANRIVDANPAFTSQTGYEVRDVLGTVPHLFDSTMHDSGFYARLWQELTANDHWQGEIADRNKDGSFTAKFVNLRVIRHPDGRIYRHVIQFNDISAQKEKDDLLWRQTNFDTLTGLPNRRLFLDRLKQDIKKAHGAGGGLGVLLLDLDRFKDINDSLGHAAGDRALIELTRRVASCVPAEATMGRLGGDSFALVVSEFDRRPHLDTIAESVIKAIAAPLHLEAAETAYVSASVGISVYPDDATDADDLVRDAEHAVHLAKRAGRGQFQYFTSSLQQQAHTKLMLTNDLRQALALRQLEVYYQPIVEVATGHIHKAETLLRWAHPTHGAVSPARFIPLAEEVGLINDISDWVLCEAIASAQRWHRMYGHVVELSVNISPTQFEQRGPSSWLDRVVHSGLPRNSITVEITEGVLIHDAEEVIHCLEALHAAGAKVSIDDFGTGFSALSYLKLFDIDYLKIDKSFINNLVSDGSDKALTEAIVDLAHRLGIEAIAEGVESIAQRDALAAIGCDYIQGYYYSQAVTREIFEKLLDRQLAH
jgi:diguanylate cyclase (GGDEF)-like protein/PAS domain S-box-containing protein